MTDRMRFWNSPLDLDDPWLAEIDWGWHFPESEAAKAECDHAIEPPRADFTEQEYIGKTFARIVEQALALNASCLHAFRDIGGLALRLQLRMPVSRLYQQRPWNPLPDFSQPVESWTWVRGLPGLYGPRRPSARYVPDTSGYVVEYGYAPAPISSRHWAWVEMMPMDADLGEVFLNWLGELVAWVPPGDSGRLCVRRHGKVLVAAVSMPRPGDVRMYFGDDRPAIRPKTPEQHREVTE